MKIESRRALVPLASDRPLTFRRPPSPPGTPCYLVWGPLLLRVR